MSDTEAADLTEGDEAPFNTKHRFTTDEIKDAVQRFFSPGYVIAWDVSNSEGCEVTDYADAIVMGAWPSRGYLIEGVRIQTTRKEWLHELKNPDKSENLRRHCDKWWLFTGLNVVNRVEEVPRKWGFVEVGMRGIKPCNATRRQASLLKDSQRDVPREFVLAMLRAAKRGNGNDVMLTVENTVRQRLSSEKVRWQEEKGLLNEEATGRLQKLTDILGEEGVNRWLSDEALLRAVAIVAKAEVAGEYGGITALYERLEGIRNFAAHQLNSLAALSSDLGIQIDKQGVEVL